MATRSQSMIIQMMTTLKWSVTCVGVRISMMGTKMHLMEQSRGLEIALSFATSAIQLFIKDVTVES